MMDSLDLLDRINPRAKLQKLKLCLEHMSDANDYSVRDFENDFYILYTSMMTDFEHLAQEKSDIERLTKELDNEISGTQNSAEKPSLCDLIGTVDRQRINTPFINRMLNNLYREANSGDLRTSASKAKDIPFVSNAICQYIGLVNATVEGIRQELTNKSLTDMKPGIL